MSPKCTTRRGTHAWCQFVCASPRVLAPARALVARADTATRKLPLARRTVASLFCFCGQRFNCGNDDDEQSRCQAKLVVRAATANDNVHQ